MNAAVAIKASKNELGRRGGQRLGIVPLLLRGSHVAPSLAQPKDFATHRSPLFFAQSFQASKHRIVPRARRMSAGSISPIKSFL